MLGRYEEALRSYEEAARRDVNHSAAKAKVAELKEAAERKKKVLSGRQELELGLRFSATLTPLIFPDDGFSFRADGNGAPTFSPQGGEVLLGAEADGAFNLYTVKADGTRLRWRARSPQGFSSLTPDGSHLLLSIPGEKGPVLRFLDIETGETRLAYGAECLEASLSPEGRSILCLGREGLKRVELPSGQAETLSERRGIESPRFSPDGKRVIFRDKGTVVILDAATGEELELLESLSGKGPVHPHLSPDGRWVVSGGNGLFLTSVEEKASLPLRHPALSGARFPSFSPDGRKLLFVRGGGVFVLELPEDFEAYFRFMRAERMLEEEGAGAALGYLNRWKDGLERHPAHHVLLGRSYLRLRFYDRAEESLLRARRVAPTWAEPALALGEVAFARGRYERALSFFERARELGPKDPRAYLHLGRTLEAMGKDERGLFALEEGISRFRQWVWQDREVGDGLKLGILELLTRQARVEEALLRLIDWRGSLGAKALEALRESPAFEALRRDSRFEELLGPRPAREKPVAAPPFRTYEALVYIDSNPNPIRARVLAEGEGFVTIEAFGVRERYPLSRVRIEPLPSER